MSFKKNNTLTFNYGSVSSFIIIGMVFGISWVTDVDPSYELTSDNMMKMFAIWMRYVQSTIYSRYINAQDLFNLAM